MLREEEVVAEKRAVPKKRVRLDKDAAAEAAATASDVAVFRPANADQL